MLKKLTSICAFIILISVFMNACASLNNIQALNESKNYYLAIEDAKEADKEEISYTLIDINESNDYIIQKKIDGEGKVLFVTWTDKPESYPQDSTICNAWGEIWVTVVPEMEDWFLENYSSGTNYVYRTEELLGLPRDKGYTHFIEMWVDPDDLWRPSPDNEITDCSAELEIPADIDSIYLAWYNENITYSYTPPRYPWTRLGYTYDWGNSKSEVGLSEFIIKKNSRIVVHKVYDNESYFEGIFGDD